MDGSIELKSKAGVGTTVIVKIPFKIGTQDKNSNLSDKLVSLGRQWYGSYMCSRRAGSS